MSEFEHSSHRVAHPEPHRLRSNLRLMTADATSFNVMVGIGETYFTFFALALGQGELISGLIATVPMLAGATLQLISPYAIERFQSYRRWVVTCATIQALSLLPLAIAAFRGGMPTSLLFLTAAIYWAAGQATVPAWNTWVEALVPTKIRAPYFACRNRLSQLGMLVGVIGGGMSLHYAKPAGLELNVYGAMFLIAAGARFLSSRCLAAHSDVRMIATPEFSDAAAKKPRLLTSNNKRLLSYVFMMQGAVYLSGPFFAVFMRDHLKYSYFELVALIASSYVARIAVLPWLGEFGHRYGAHRLLWLGAIGIMPLPGLWMVSTDFYFLLGLQIVGGMVWGAHELAMSLLFIDSIPRPARIRVLSIFNFGNSAAMATGTVLGATFLAYLGKSPDNYLRLFAASSLLRIVAIVLLKQVPRLRPIEPLASPESHFVTEGSEHPPMLRTAAALSKTSPAVCLAGKP